VPTTIAIVADENAAHARLRFGPWHEQWFGRNPSRAGMSELVPSPADIVFGAGTRGCMERESWTRPIWWILCPTMKPLRWGASSQSP
jgi:hypothetical protein